MSLFGKWSQQGVPKKGWTCIGFEDLGGALSQTFVVNQYLRFVR